MARTSRFRKRDSDRSGFTFLDRELVVDEGSLVGADEFDTPPPSKKSLGGEGDISEGDVRVGAFEGTVGETTASTAVKPKVQTVTAGGGITFSNRIYESSGEELNLVHLQVVGSNLTNLNITVDPQVSAGRHGNKLVLEGVGSSVILEDGNGLSLRRLINLDSGALINLFYTETDSVWMETSRSRREHLLVHGFRENQRFLVGHNPSDSDAIIVNFDTRDGLDDHSVKIGH